MQKKLILFILMTHLTILSYEPMPGSIESTLSVKTNIDPIENIAKQRYQDAWFFKQKRQEKYQHLANHLDQDVQKALIDHKLTHKISNDEATFQKIQTAIKNLQSNKRFSFAGNDNFSGHLLQDLKNLYDKMSKKIQQTNTKTFRHQQEVLKKHQHIFEKINSTKPTLHKVEENLTPPDQSSNNSEKETTVTNVTEHNISAHESIYKARLPKKNLNEELKNLDQKISEINDLHHQNEKKLTQLNKQIQYQTSQLEGIYNQITEIKKNIPAQYFKDEYAMNEYTKLIQKQTELQQLPTKLNAQQYQRKIDLVADIETIKMNIENIEQYNKLNSQRAELESKIQNLQKLRVPLLKIKEDINDQKYDLQIKIANVQHKQRLSKK